LHGNTKPGTAWQAQAARKGLLEYLGP